MGVDVPAGVELGRVAVCEPAPMDTKATLGPSFTIRTHPPCPGKAVDAPAEAVTVRGSVLEVAENGFILLVFSTLVDTAQRASETFSHLSYILALGLCLVSHNSFKVTSSMNRGLGLTGSGSAIFMT